MKKLVLAVFAAVFFVSAAFAVGEVNVKLGLGNLGYASNDDTFETGGKKTVTNTEFGVNFAVGGEYLYPINDIFKVGAGVKYISSLATVSDSENSDATAPSYSFLPIYATIQANPIPADRSIFFKLNIGYNPLFSSSDSYYDVLADVHSVSIDKKGGLYWALETGYEFESGILFSVSYETLYYGYEYEDLSADLVSGQLGISIGYKFKI